MFKYTNSGITLTAMLDTRKATKDNLFPVKIRVTYQRERWYYATGKYLSKEDWEKLSSTRSQRLLEIHKDIETAFDKVKTEIKELVKVDTFTLEALNKRLGSAGTDTINTAFQAKVDALSAQGKVSTSDWYKYALRSIKLFAGDNIKFMRVTVDWLKQYEQHLLQQGKSYTTISMYMRALQVIMNDAKSAGIVKAALHPFGKGRYEIPQHEGRDYALTVKEIGKIASFKCALKTTEMCRDLWLFSYLCNGANITDVCKLKYANIINGEICFYRQKTIAKAKKKKMVQAVITPKMQAIINQWGNTYTKQDDFIFPFLKGEESPVDERRIIKNITHLINDKMKEIGKAVGISHISTYTARHSFATVLKRTGKVSVAYISESLGHRDIKTTETYLARFEQEERKKNAALLTKF